MAYSESLKNRLQGRFRGHCLNYVSFLVWFCSASFSQPDVRIGDSSTYTVRTGPLDTSQEDTAHLKDTTLVAVASVQASTAELVVKAGTR